MELFENQDFTVVSKKIENINEYTDKYLYIEEQLSDDSFCKLGICKCSKRGISQLYEIDAYKDFRKTLLAAMNKGEDVEAADSKSKIVINFQDRTPPLIKYDGVNSESISESGFARIIEDLKVKDNIEVTPYHNDEELKPIENIK